MRYRIGLDIGIKSIGWAVIEDNDDGEPIDIIDLGVRIFDAAEVAKTGASLAETRRIKRSTRRRNRRKIFRINRVKQLLLDNNIIINEELDDLYNNHENIYKLRVDALDNKISNIQLSKLLINFVKKRGYFSNSKSEELISTESDKSAVKTCLNDNSTLVEKYRTVGEMYYKDEKFKYKDANNEIILYHNEPILKTRNTTENYITTVERKYLVKEIELILNKQKEFNPLVTDKFIEEYLYIFLSQRNFDEGPGLPSKYGGNLIESMLGNCTFLLNEKRAPKATYTFEMFKLLQDLNNIKIEKLNINITNSGNIYHKVNNDIRILTIDEKKKIIKHFTKSENITFKALRKLLNISYDYIFNMVKYNFKIENINNKDKELIKQIDEQESKLKIQEMQSFHKMRIALNKYKKDYIIDLLEMDKGITINKIATVLTLYKGDEKRINELKILNLNNEIINCLLPLYFNKVSHLSITAMNELIPLLEQGLTYDKAATQIFGDYRGLINTKKKRKIVFNELEKIYNPVVNRSVSQTIKVVNAITNKYGNPELINIELAREIGKNRKDREALDKDMKKNSEANENAVKEIKSAYNKENITGIDIVKYKLWKEQNEICMYSGEHIDITDLFTKAVDVDHIIPYSKCFDDSYNNKVLVKANENRMKSNRTPLEYLNGSNRNIDEYIVRVQNTYKNNYKKRNKLLKESITSEDYDKWKNRNLKDTQYIARFILDTFIDKLQIAPNNNISENKRVMAVKGGITAEVRKLLQLNKIRDNDKHHAMDAAVIAITTENMTHQITRYFQNRETNANDRTKTKEEIKQKFLIPNYPEFKDELVARLQNTDEEVKNAITLLNKTSYKLKTMPKAIFVSRMPKHKVKGSAHKETIMGMGNNNKLIKKVSLAELKLENWDKQNQNSNGKGEVEIANYYNKQDDTLLYNALKNRLMQYNNDAKEAFKEPFYKPRKDGTPGPLVKKVKLEEKSSSNLYLNKIKGIACNGDMVRIDIFYVEDEGYYLVPIYVADIIKKELPNKACVAYKDSSEWKEMNDKNFIFSLYPNDLVYMKHKKGIKLNNIFDKAKESIIVNEFLGYYNSANITTAAIKIENQDKTFNQDSIGIKTLLEMKKYQVDVLGNISEVKLPEKRMKFEIKK